MGSIGFGIERLAWSAVKHPRVWTVIFLIALALAGFGATRLGFDEDMRNIFASDSTIYDSYLSVTDDYVDPENELILLVEGKAIGEPATLTKLQDLQFELQFAEGIDNVYSMFALREQPDEGGAAPPLVNDTSQGLTPDLIAAIRAHPIMGDKMVSADGASMIYFLTPTEPKASLRVARGLQREIEAITAGMLDGTGLTTTMTGFPVVRADITDILKRDQIVLNGVGALIGFVMSFIVFRSLTAAILTSFPAIIGGFVVVGFMGLFGVPITVMSNVVPAVVMILGYADGMHLSFAYRRARDEGRDVGPAELHAQHEVGGACILAAITTSVAFASLTISEVAIVRSFGAAGAVATTAGAVVVLVAHGLLTLALGRYWKRSSRDAQSFLNRMEGPSAAIGGFAVRFARPLGYLAIVLLVAFAWMHYSVPPQHSVREHLPADNVANAALGRIDQHFGGIFPIQVIVPEDDTPMLTAAGLARIGAVHEAVAGFDQISTPLSLWSLVEWLGGDADEATAQKVSDLLDELSPTTRSRFLGRDGGAIVTGNVVETSTEETRPLVDAVTAAAQKAGGDDVVVTGVTVITVLESARTINGLNYSLTLSVIVNLIVIAIAFRSLAVGVLSFLPNILPILTVGATLFLTGGGMQFTSVIALTVAFGIAVDGTVHYLNRYVLVGEEVRDMSTRLVEAARHVGPVLFGTTIVLIAGMSSTLTSGLPTIALFGKIASSALAVALIGDLIILPALIRAFGSPWFGSKFVHDHKPDMTDA